MRAQPVPMLEEAVPVSLPFRLTSLLGLLKRSGVDDLGDVATGQSLLSKGNHFLGHVTTNITIYPAGQRTFVNLGVVGKT
ncbi:hypothetical protein P378_06895 [Desulforamulus profundi]|uniref:Uncharacterized protein n=1 Tax=Desulforamulus profundi TaxID=1383067 RepID=A0A2C6MFC1_9FIRM|nr:hypothetical protein P378_06895 [Desulforamulus profundi]